MGPQLGRRIPNHSSDCSEISLCGNGKYLSTVNARYNELQSNQSLYSSIMLGCMPVLSKLVKVTVIVVIWVFTPCGIFDLFCCFGGSMFV